MFLFLVKQRYEETFPFILMLKKQQVVGFKLEKLLLVLTDSEQNCTEKYEKRTEIDETPYK